MITHNDRRFLVDTEAEPVREDWFDRMSPKGRLVLLVVTILLFNALVAFGQDRRPMFLTPEQAAQMKAEQAQTARERAIQMRAEQIRLEKKLEAEEKERKRAEKEARKGESPEMRQARKEFESAEKEAAKAEKKAMEATVKAEKKAREAEAEANRKAVETEEKIAKAVVNSGLQGCDPSTVQVHPDAAPYRSISSTVKVQVFNERSTSVDIYNPKQGLVVSNLCSGGSLTLFRARGMTDPDYIQFRFVARESSSGRVVATSQEYYLNKHDWPSGRGRQEYDWFVK